MLVENKIKHGEEILYVHYTEETRLPDNNKILPIKNPYGEGFYFPVPCALYTDDEDDFLIVEFKEV